MRHIGLTVVVCITVTAFTAAYHQITGLLVRAILEGFSCI
jgi:hypothetical protein